MYYWSKFAETFSTALFQIWAVLARSSKNATWRTKLSLVQECTHETPETLLATWRLFPSAALFRHSHLTAISSSRCATWISKSANTHFDKFKICQRANECYQRFCKCIQHSEQSICWSKLLAGVVHVHFAGIRNQSKNRFQTAPLLWAVFIQGAVFSPCNKTLMKIYNCENHHLITTCWGAVSFSSFQE